MLKYEREQKICTIGGVKVGGRPGERAPLLIGNMFQKGDLILESRKEGRFDRRAAQQRIHEVERFSRETAVPCLIAMVANSEEEMKGYIDFFTSVTDMPFAVDIWQQKTRLAAARYVVERSLQARVLYNSITPWDEDIEGQVSELRELGIKHVVVQVFDVGDKRPTGRVSSLKRLLPLVERGNFESILIDTAVMNLPATAFSLMANQLIKKEFGLPVGFAPSNGTYMWRKNASEQEKKRFQAIDAGVHAISALASDFLFYGPLTGTSRVFPAVAAATSMMAAAAFAESSVLPIGEHPLNLLFPDVVKQFQEKEGVK
ncbi:MAG TPA: tetrahydromethanopterin S-methyltransferase subunit H [Syntrophorhabdales bacterium]|nr:tetrahydromethanopterin S-methyltransferase subunit H [Syntrophorhabdales bacterium]